jgi:hypothetical protein
MNELSRKEFNEVIRFNKQHILSILHNFTFSLLTKLFDSGEDGKVTSGEAFLQSDAVYKKMKKLYESLDVFMEMYTDYDLGCRFSCNEEMKEFIKKMFEGGNENTKENTKVKRLPSFPNKVSEAMDDLIKSIR